MTKSPTPLIWSRFRLPYLLVVTGGAIATTLYLIAPHTERWSAATCWAIFAVAWGSAIGAWRRHRPHLRRWSGIYTFGIVVVGFVGLTMLLSGLWARKKIHPSATSMPTAISMARYVAESQELRAAIASDDLARVETVLQTTDSATLVGGSDRVGFTLRPLDYAVEKGRLQIAAVLLDHGATVSDERHNPLPFAASRDDLPMMRLLIHHGAPVNDEHNWNGGSPALWGAALHGHAKSVDYLLKAGANPQTWEPTVGYQARRSVLQLARAAGNTQIVKRLQRAGATQ